MRRFLLIVLGLVQVLFALAVGFAVTRWWQVDQASAVIGMNRATLVGSTVLAGATALACLLNGLRLLGVSRWRGWALPGASGVLAVLTIGLVAVDIHRTESRPRVSEASLAAVGKPFPLKFTAFGGGEIDLAAMKGKVVLLDFWATWCGPCKGQMPHIRAAHDKWHAQGFEVIGISCDHDEAALRSYLQASALPWRHYFDGKGMLNPLVQRYQLRGIPQLWLIDKNGVLRDVDAYENLDRKIEALLRG